MSNYAPTRGHDLPSAYAAASDRLTGRCATRRKIANNTYLERRGEDIAIRLHQTDVVTFHPDGTLTLDTGGWLTMTTKARMCDALHPLGYRLDSNRGRWTLHAIGHWSDTEDRWVPSDWPAVPYADGMTLDPATGRVSGVPDDTAVKAEDTENTRVRKLIETYLRKTTPAQIVAAFDDPGGDCWLCMAGLTDREHLISHLDEHYVMLNLTRNAVIERGYRDPDFILGAIYHTAKRGTVDTLFRDNLRKFFRKHTAVGACATR